MDRPHRPHRPLLPPGDGDEWEPDDELRLPGFRPGEADPILPASDKRELGAVDVIVPDEDGMLAGATAFETGWRVLELWSEEGLPWEADIRWTGGGAGGQRALVTVAGGTARICICAKAILSVKPTNLSSDAHLVKVAVSSVGSAITCHNHYLMVRFGGKEPRISVRPPPYATYLRVTGSDPTAAAGAFLELLDGLGELVARLPLSDQPSGGQPVTGIRQVDLIPVAGVRYQLDFTLGV